ncbi:MAG: class I SAM-dependent methyltransferase [Gemmatimonadota bacterium]
MSVPRNGDPDMTPSSPPGAEMFPEQIEFLTNLIGSEDLPGPHLEVGTAAGVTLAAMIQALPTPRHPAFVVVDNMRYFPDQLNVVRANLERHGVDPDTVEFRIGDSSELFEAAERSGDSFDFIVIDASHRIRRVTGDLRWTRLLRPGGMVCLHDYHPDFPGVVRSVDRFLERHPNYERMAQVGSLLTLRKRGESSQPEVSTADRVWAVLWSVVHKLRR